jgi:hypothetical protein
VAYLIWQRGRPREVIDRGRTDAEADVDDGSEEHRTRDGGSVPASPPVRPEEP